MAAVAAPPPSPGYETWLTEQKVDPFIARMITRLSVRAGNRVALESRTRSEAVKAIRFLAAPRHRRSAMQKRMADLLAIERDSSISEEIFKDCQHRWPPFVQALEAATSGDAEAFKKVVEIAQDIAPRLSIPRGPKVTAASAAHQFILKTANQKLGVSAYTYDPIINEYTDRLTRATREQFKLKKFDPKPAYRRAKVGTKSK